MVWLAWAVLSVFHFLFLLKFFQLEEYNEKRFLNFVMFRWPPGLRFSEVIALAAALSLYWFGGSRFSMAVAGIAALIGMAVSWIVIRWQRKTEIKELVFTGRVKRLLAAGIVLTGLISVGLWLLTLRIQGESTRQETLFIASLLAAGQFIPLVVVLANWVLFPYEEVMRRFYVWDARKVLTRISPITIGVTGSYGKTTTKEILAHILSSRFDVLKTPRSFNTLLGVCRVIREDLKPFHKLFVVEMGAYKAGEIRSICDLVRPATGIITAIGPQHLERFKTIDNVIKAKNELIQSLPENGLGIFNIDDPNCLVLANQAKCRVKRYGITNRSDADLYAEALRLTSEGSVFDLVIKETDERIEVKTLLLGQHNVLNIMGALLAAQEAGIPLKQAARAVSSVVPPAHRLQTIHQGQGIITIDDSYNSNPIGARMALDVLASYATPGKKVLVTPGYAELGAIQVEEHEHLGRMAGVVCDMIILIGDEHRTGQISKGVRQTGFDASQIYCYNSLAQAKEFLTRQLKPGDVVLFENDLPDQYL
jgi:UDP-N-acetylmuramoyl-tripeptide--D-alanyl-D-alanine ligase